MAEISRKESKSAIIKWLGCNDCDTDECLSCICVDCKNHYDEDAYRQALDKALSDMEKLEKIEQNLQHIDLAIRCAMCTNIMANDQGCDGGCRINESMYKAVLDIIDKEIEQILRGGE